MLENIFAEIYKKFKLHFYRRIFSRFETREASLTAVETFCVEVIHALGTPTVNEFARFVNISQPNATHKIQSLIKKGYVDKTQSVEDRREYTLSVTDKFHQYYDLNNSYLAVVMQRVRDTFSAEELALLERILGTINNKLMPEINI